MPCYSETAHYKAHHRNTYRCTEANAVLMAHIYTIANRKGGVGKTTTAVNLAAGLAREGRRVLLIDVDPEGTIDRWLHLEPRATLYDVITGAVDASTALVQVRENLDVLVSGGEQLERYVFGLRRAKQIPMLLEPVLAPLKQHYHYIILDNGPGLDPLQLAAFVASSDVVIPTTLQRLGIDGLEKQYAAIQSLQDGGYPVQLSTIVPTLYDQQSREQRHWLAQLAEFPQTTLPIRYDNRLLELPRFGRTIFEHAPKSHAAHDYQALTRRIIDGT